MAKKKPTQRISDDERGARRALIEQFFYDFSRSPAKVYWINFVRGIFFGVGSILGGTIVIAIIVWVLSWLVDLPGGIGSFVQYIVDLVQKRQ